MQTKLYVGNLSYNAKEEDIKDLFGKYGSVQSVSLITDKYSGQSKGFGFVEMSKSEEAEKALELNGTEFLGRNINVSEARPQEDRPKRSGGGGGRPGGGFKRGGGGGGFNRDRGGRGGGRW